MLMGPIRYGIFIGLPSAFSDSGSDTYYNSPWEITADMFAGVERPEHTYEDKLRGIRYFFLFS